MKRKNLTTIITWLITLMFTASAHAYSSQVASGLSWLSWNQESDGPWRQANAGDYQTTAEAITTLSIISSTDLTYTNGLSWLEEQAIDTTDYLARMVYAKRSSHSPEDLNALLALKNANGSWGGYMGYEDTNIDTALALSALKTANYNDQTVIDTAIIYLLSTQNPDGGFGFYQGDDSSIYMTALVSQVLQQFPQTTTIATAINSATAYLNNHQNIDGGFGSGGGTTAPTSTAYETAYAYIALVGVTTDNTVLGNAVNYLTTTQLTDGSWNQDAYSRALAMRALYLSENRPVMPPPGPPTEITPEPDPTPDPVPLTETTITGTVTDASTGQSVAFADVSLSGTGITTMTAVDGTYTLSGVPALDFSLTASAAGYDSFIYSITTTAYGTYSVNFTLTQSQESSNVRVTSVNIGSVDYAAETDVVITGEIENTGNTGRDILISAHIQNIAGEIIAIASPSNPIISLASMTTVPVVIIWNTGLFTPGEYRIILRATDPATVGYGNPNGTLIAQKSTILKITPISKISGAIALNPPVTTTGASTPIAITAVIRNTGNAPLTTTLRLTAALSGQTALAYTTEQAITELPVNNIAEINLGSFIPSEGGTYTVTLAPIDTNVTGVIAATLYSGPHATGTFTITPTKALPGNVRGIGNIRLEGVGAQDSGTQDPLVPLIKAAIQKGVNYEQPAVMSWHNTNKCYGCHIQTQALYGLENSRTRATIDEGFTRTIFDALKGWQRSNGTVGDKYYYFDRTATQLGLWAYTSWHDEDEAKPYITKSADYLLSRQASNGSWICDHCTGWWGSTVSATSISMTGIAKAYILSNDPRYLTSINNAVQYLLTPNIISSDDNMRKAHLIIVLEAALTTITDPARRSQISNTIDTTISQLKTPQRADGGWGANAANVSDSLVTAQILYAMLKAGVSGDDNHIRKAIQYLLNTQAADGSWQSQNKVLNTRLAVTTWVIISLPIALEKVGGIDTETHITLPIDITLNSAMPPPTYQTGRDYTWKFTGVDETGKDITLDMTVQDLQLGEKRPAALEAYMIFKNGFTQETVRTDIEIPFLIGDSLIDMELSLDNMNYAANSNTNITTTITNGNTTSKDLTLTWTIGDHQGITIAGLPGSAATLSLGETINIPATWNTGQSFAGDYRSLFKIT